MHVLLAEDGGERIGANVAVFQVRHQLLISVNMLVCHLITRMFMLEARLILFALLRIVNN